MNSLRLYRKPETLTPSHAGQHTLLGLLLLLLLLLIRGVLALNNFVLPRGMNAD